MPNETRYPDALNLPARAALAIQALTALRDESLKGLQRGDVAALQYDLPTSTRTYPLGDEKYVVDFKGDTAVRIAPPGKYAPLYQRQGYLANVAPEREQPWRLPPREMDSP